MQNQLLCPTPDIVIVEGQTITENVKSQFIISGATLNPGGTVTLGSASSMAVIVLSTGNKGQNIIL
jgi:hypothetical protein